MTSIVIIEISRSISSHVPYFITYIIKLLQSSWKILWLETKNHPLRPFIQIWYHFLQSSFNANSYFIHLIKLFKFYIHLLARFFINKFFMIPCYVSLHLFQPFILSECYNIIWPILKYGACDSWKLEVTATCYNSFIIETSKFCLEKTCLY